MSNWKGRLFGIVLIVVFAGMMYYNWQQVQAEGQYSMKMAVFGPVGVIGGLFLFLFPDKGGRPESTRDKIIAMLVFAIGLAGGVYNWYLMDPGFFGK